MVCPAIQQAQSVVVNRDSAHYRPSVPLIFLPLPSGHSLSPSQPLSSFPSLSSPRHLKLPSEAARSPYQPHRINTNFSLFSEGTSTYPSILPFLLRLPSHFHPISISGPIKSI